MGLRLRGLVTAALLLAAVTAPLDAAVPPVAERGAKRAPRECSEVSDGGGFATCDTARVLDTSRRGEDGGESPRRPPFRRTCAQGW
jgi:hypothetical protein